MKLIDLKGDPMEGMEVVFEKVVEVNSVGNPCTKPNEWRTVQHLGKEHGYGDVFKAWNEEGYSLLYFGKLIPKKKELENGKVYKHTTSKNIIIKTGKSEGFGLDYKGDFIIGEGWSFSHHPNEWQPFPMQEFKAMLLKEALKKYPIIDKFEFDTDIIKAYMNGCFVGSVFSLNTGEWRELASNIMEIDGVKFKITKV